MTVGEPVSVGEMDVEVVKAYKFLVVEIDHKLNCTGVRIGYFQRSLASFNICRKLLQMFYQSVVSSVLFYSVVCWGGNARQRDIARLDRLIKRAGKVTGTKLDSVAEMAERRTLAKTLAILDNANHPLHSALYSQKSNFSNRLLSLSCRTDRLKKSFIPRAIESYNRSLGAVGGRRGGRVSH